LQGALTVTTGLKSQTGSGSPTALTGERNTVQTVVEFVAAQDLAAARTRLVDESRSRNAQHVIYLFGRTAPEMDTLVADIYRCREIVQHYRNEPDQDFDVDYGATGVAVAVELTDDLSTWRTLDNQEIDLRSLVRRTEPPALQSEAAVDREVAWVLEAIGATS
jgi:hypothetical protein